MCVFVRACACVCLCLCALVDRPRMIMSPVLITRTDRVPLPEPTISAVFEEFPDLKDAPASFEIDGKTFKSVEAFFHYSKYAETHPVLAEGIRTAGSALSSKKANTAARKVGPPFLLAWDWFGLDEADM